MSRYKYCIVPQCKNTTRSTPDKLFFSVPTGEKRKKWCVVMGRVPGKHKTLSAMCNRFICEDHFNLREDMENYMMWKTVGVGKLMLKKGRMPHKFECQNQHVKKSNVLNDNEGRTESEKYEETVTTEIKEENIKKEKTALNYNTPKSIDQESQSDLGIEIKKEMSECESESDDEANIIVKDEVNEIETYVFNVHYDSDTGSEYLINPPTKLK